MNFEELHRALRQIHCSGMEQALEARLQQAQADDLRPVELLELLVHDEIDCRRERALQRRLRRARFRDLKTLDVFDWNFNKQIDRRMIFELATCKFIEQKLSVCMIGNSGTGKSHLVQGIGYAAVHANYSVLYKEILLLNEELTEAHLRGEQYHAAYVKKFSEPALVILEDIALHPVSPQVARDLVNIIMMRYERAATIVTSNRLPGDWTEYFADIPAMMTFIDRMMHGYVIEVKGESYRLHQSRVRHQEQRIEQRLGTPPPQQQQNGQASAPEQPKRPIIVDESSIPSVPQLKPVDRYSPQYRSNGSSRPEQDTHPRGES